MNINELIDQIGGRERLAEIRAFTHTNGIEHCNRQEWQIMASALLAVLDAQKEPVAFYANNVYYNTERAALKDGAQSVMPLYTFPPAANVPDAWKLVPTQPTQRMIDAHTEGMANGGATRAYRDMLAAAPAPGGDGG